jgi:competence ComEA-like helix-hairpin-helix protein
MSFYRAMLAAVAAIAIAAPAFADDTVSTTGTDSTTTTTTTTSTSTEQTTKVDLNKASVSELMKVKGLNRSKAKAIVSYRQKNGDFKSTDDLVNVKGFKKLDSSKLKEIQDQLTI